MLGNKEAAPLVVENKEMAPENRGEEILLENETQHGGEDEAMRPLEHSTPCSVSSVQPCDVDVRRVDAMLRQLEGRGPMCFTAFARDTPAGRSR